MRVVLSTEWQIVGQIFRKGRLIVCCGAIVGGTIDAGVAAATQEVLDSIEQAAEMLRLDLC
jgi:hypothetical protein